MRALAALLAVAPALAQPAPTGDTPALSLGAALRGLLDDPHLRHARAGVCVRDLASGQTVAAHDDDKGFMTASNMKLISSAVALHTLGPEFVFTTRLVSRATVRDGTLDGDLVLVGSGDPTFGGRHETHARAPFERFARRLRDELGIRVIDGDVVGDDDCQPDEVLGEGWSWNYEAADYAAQVSGLCFAENTVRFELRPAPVGQTPELRQNPPTSYVTVDNLVRAHAGPTALDVARARGTNRVYLRGTVAAGQNALEACAIDNPTAFAAHVLRECLLEAGITVRGRARDGDDAPVAPDGAAPTVLAEHRSPPLREVLHTLNKVSQNLYAEQVIRAAARVATGRAHMRDAAAHAAAVLSGLGIDIGGLAIADGSGLTRLNLVQPRQLAGLLAAMWQSEHRAVFVDTLPIAGVDGTLASRMQRGPARGRVRAKTGFISRVVALSGYVPRAGDTPPLVFSILLNNFTCDTKDARAAVDEFVQALAALHP